MKKPTSLRTAGSAEPRSVCLSALLLPQQEDTRLNEMKNVETLIQVFICSLISSDSGTLEWDKVNGELLVCACNTQWVSDWTSRSQEMACQYGLLWSPFMCLCVCVVFVRFLVSINPSRSISFRSCVDLHVLSGVKSCYPDTSDLPASSLWSSFRLNLCDVIDLLSWWNSFIYTLNIFTANCPLNSKNEQEKHVSATAFAKEQTYSSEISRQTVL